MREDDTLEPPTLAWLTRDVTGVFCWCNRCDHAFPVQSGPPMAPVILLTDGPDRSAYNWAMSDCHEFGERRRSARRKVLRTGIIVYGENASLMKCVVLDISPEGARLRPENPAAAPREFTHMLAGGNVFDCTVSRKTRRELAVRLVRRL